MPRSPHYRRLIERAMRESVPLDVALELTHRCNFNCRHCYLTGAEQRSPVETNRLLELLGELAEMGTLYLALTGGEPLLRDDWDVIARRARELGFWVMLLTNGSLIDDRVADTIAELDLTVEISLYSVDEPTFEGVTGRRKSFRRVLRGIERLVGLGVDLELQVPIMDLNRGSLPDVVRWAESRDLRWQSFAKITPGRDGGRGPVEHRLSENELRAYYRVVPGVGCVLPEIEGGVRQADDLPLCAAGTRYACVTVGGDVLACNIMPGTAGNVRRTSFRTIWTESSWLFHLRSIRRRDLRVCSTCDKLSYCGRCPAMALIEDGDLLGPSSDACEHAAALERALRRGA